MVHESGMLIIIIFYYAKNAADMAHTTHKAEHKNLENC